ncbi:hypothetical protein JTB14_017450 [Gonioctena quinquepunctata]|nr:hypothetical protein JTB14_017450 [Gonioctena quinquepunctata]
MESCRHTSVDKAGNLNHKTRIIFYPIISDIGPNEETDDEIILRALKATKTLNTQREVTKLAIPEIVGIHRDNTSKREKQPTTKGKTNSGTDCWSKQN